jgi:phosphopantothenate---cysteine ligase (CTP)
MKIFITSGGTKIPIDRVRNITNMSKGTFGAKIAYEALKQGHDVSFFKAVGSASPMSKTIDLMDGYSVGQFSTWHNDRSALLPRYSECEYDTFDEYVQGLEEVMPLFNPDVILLAAAVSDYGVENFVDGKVRSRTDEFQIKLKPLPKLISRIKTICPKAKLVGFKLLVDSTEEELIAAAAKSIADNGCDMVVANDLSDMRKGKHNIRLVLPVEGGGTLVHKFETDPNDPNYLAWVVAKFSATL